MVSHEHLNRTPPLCFPQWQCSRYAIYDLEDAVLYLSHPVLGPRYVAIAAVVHDQLCNKGANVLRECWSAHPPPPLPPQFPLSSHPAPACVTHSASLLFLCRCVVVRPVPVSCVLDLRPVSRTHPHAYSLLPGSYVLRHEHSHLWCETCGTVPYQSSFAQLPPHPPSHTHSSHASFPPYYRNPIAPPPHTHTLPHWLPPTPPTLWLPPCPPPPSA